MADKTILAVDCGTQSLRTIIFSKSGKVLAQTKVEYKPYFSTNPGWAEQDPEIYWNSLCQACSEMKKEFPKYFADISGVGVTSQRASMVNVDKDGNPLRPAIIWLDQRKALPRFVPKHIVKMVLKLINMDQKIFDIQADGKCTWIRQNQPEIWEKTHKYLQISGFLNHRLTGNFSDSIASQIGHIPFNYKKMKWAGKFDLPKFIFPVEKEKLPILTKPGELLGQISNIAASQTGITKGVHVIACGSDKGCETIGAGVIDKKMVSLSFGTTATVQTTTDKYFETIPFMPPYPAPMPGFYNPEIEIFRGYWMITWFKNEFSHKEILEEKKNIAVEKLLNQYLLKTKPGSMGLIMQPYWSPGLEHPSAKGAIIGFGDVHKKEHIYRSIIEGLGFGLLEGFYKMETKGKFKAKKVAVSGGASQSDEICKITADIFNLPIVKGRTHETSGLGAAIVTAVGLDFYSSFKEAIGHMVKQTKMFEPDPKNVEIYQKLYNGIYKKMFKALKPLYDEIRDITGYPE